MKPEFQCQSVETEGIDSGHDGVRVFGFGRSQLYDLAMIRESIQFPNGRTAEAIHVGKTTSAKEIVEEMRAPAPGGVICLNGGTAKLDEALKRRLTDLL